MIDYPEPISFNPNDAVQSVEEGTDRFTLRCNVSGNPVPTVTWNARGTVIRDDKSDKYKVSKDGLIIYNVTKEDGGNYKCKAIQIKEFNI